LAIDLLKHYAKRYAAWILTVWRVKGKAVEGSQDAGQEVLLPAYRVTGKPETILATSSPRATQTNSVDRFQNPLTANLAPSFFPYVFLTNLLVRPYAMPDEMKLEFSA
jgi:hypothetical protein